MIRFPDTASETILARLASMPGMNMSRGMAMLRGNAERYLDVLGNFIAAHVDDMTRLSASLANGEYAVARRLTHTLKGTAATLGVDHLAKLAGHLEKVIRANQNGMISCVEIQPEIEAIRLVLAELASVLPSQPTPPHTVESTPVDPGRVRKGASPGNKST